MSLNDIVFKLMYGIFPRPHISSEVECTQSCALAGKRLLCPRTPTSAVSSELWPTASQTPYPEQLLGMHSKQERGTSPGLLVHTHYASTAW